MKLLKDKAIDNIITNLNLANEVMQQLKHMDRSHNNVDDMSEKLQNVLISLDSASTEAHEISTTLNYYGKLIKEVRVETLIRDGAKKE